MAEWCSQHFNKKKRKKDKSFICFCTKNLECSDLIGTQKIADFSEDGFERIKFEPRFLYKAIKRGNCVVLDSINEAPSRVIERLNGLLDKKNSEDEEKFEIPEDSAESEIKIHEDFRIICTSNFRKINQISPSFVNRFEVIVLEDQFNGIVDSKMKELIKFLFKKYQKECYDKYKKRQEKKERNIDIENKEENDNNDEYPFEKKDNENLIIEKEIEITQDMVDKIFKKCQLLSKEKNPNESSDDSTLGSSRNVIEFDENSKKYLTMTSINKLCRTFIILKNEFRDKAYINLDSIINFSFDLLFEKQLLDKKDRRNDYKPIQEHLEKELTKYGDKVQDSGNEQYFFKNSESLKNFLVQIYACSLVNQLLCIVGPPGIGKTVGARKFSNIREKIFGIKYDLPFYMHTFHQFTRQSDYFGISSLKDEKLVFREGTLTKSIKQGNVFIGDEFNISSEDCMKAIAPVLELKFGQDILIPGIEGSISIDHDFFFIICQNDKSTFGRKDLPEKIKVKIKVINYPKRIENEIEDICVSMYSKLAENESHKDKIKDIFDNDGAKLCGDFMMKLNEKEILTPWSLRDISKLFARIKKQSKNPKNYDNLGLKEQILFYILSSTSDFLIKERVKTVVDLMHETFNLTINEKHDLLELYDSIPHLNSEKDKQKIYIEKGKVNIFFCNKDEKIYEQLNKLPSILNTLFKILITSDDEPILISGPSSFKTFLAKLLFHNEKCEVISLNSELTVSQLIGSPTLLTTEKAKNFYLLQIYEILQENNIGNLLKDLEDFEANKENIKKNIEESSKEKNINKNHPFYHALQHFKTKLFGKNKNKKSLFDMIIEFKPGIFISALIKGSNLILKNITNVKTENLERLNEALTGNKKITLNEDTQNSFTQESDKEIKFNNFRIVGTCNEGEETSLSEAFLSRFTLIYIEKYPEEEERQVLKNFAKYKQSFDNQINQKEIKDKEELEGDIDIDSLNKKLDEYYEKFPDTIRLNLAKKINCIKITREMGKIMKNNLVNKNLNLVLYYLLKGVNEKRGQKIKEINELFNIDKYYDNENNSPIKIINSTKGSFILSTFSNIIMELNPQLEKKENNEKEKKENINLVFTNKIKEIIDVIHFALSLKIPLILEGKYGQGKKSAIEYYAKMARFELILVQISKSTKVEDLLSKTTFKRNEKGGVSLVNAKTPLCNAIECLDNFPDKLIVFEGINNATPAVLEVLNSIYGEKGTNILLPNGTKIEKRNIKKDDVLGASYGFWHPSGKYIAFSANATLCATNV